MEGMPASGRKWYSEGQIELIYMQLRSYIELYQQQSLLNTRIDRAVAKELGELALLLAHVPPCLRKQLVDYPKVLIEFLRSSARVLPSSLRLSVTEALIFLVNNKIVSIKDTLVLFMDLQILSDKALKKRVFSHVIRSIKKMNRNHKNEKENRALQSILFSMLQEETDDRKAMRSLATIWDLYRIKVWFDDRTSNAICRACFHSSPRVRESALSFLLGFENVDQDLESGDEQEEATHQHHVVVSKEAIYKAKNTGTTSSKKKKKAKLKRVIRSMKKQQRRSSQVDNNFNYSSPLSSLNDPQGFAEKLFSQLQSRQEPFEIKMMMMKVIARTVGLHRLILLGFYPFLQKYVQSHQKNVTSLLAAAVQACHDMVPPDAVEPLFKQVVNQFVHDRSRTESIAVGLNVVREICLRIPLLMTDDLLQDLVLYKKSHEKAVSSAARSLISLFREICPSLLIKKDRGRPADPNAKPKAFGEVTVPSDVPGADLLRDDDDSNASTDAGDHLINSYLGEEDTSRDDDEQLLESEKDDVSCSDSEDVISIDGTRGSNKIIGKKRKLVDLDGELDSACHSLGAFKTLAGGVKLENDDTSDGIFSNEDFRRISELKAKKEARLALAHHGLLKTASDQKFKIPSADQLRLKRVDGYALEANLRKKMTKEERKAIIKAGREDTGKYQAKAAFKRQKTGGLSNRQKEHKKAMPVAARRSKIERSKRQKKMKQRGAGKQFRGRKAWK